MSLWCKIRTTSGVAQSRSGKLQRRLLIRSRATYTCKWLSDTMILLEATAAADRLDVATFPASAERLVLRRYGPLPPYCFDRTGKISAAEWLQADGDENAIARPGT